tara:strand:- start:11200 stop:11856 length:657 start_codon:yes stop_codon:yes gene_type:complete
MTPEEFIAQYGTVTLNWEGIDKVLVDEDHVVTYKNNVFFSSFTIVLHENQYVVHGEHNTTRIITHYKYGVVHCENGPAKTEYYDDDRLVIKMQYWIIDGDLSRVDGPCELIYFPSGNKAREMWGVGGNIHRLDAPALQVWHGNGQLAQEIWGRHGNMHRDDGPAYSYWWPNGQPLPKMECWFKEKKLHREGAPAVIKRDEQGNETETQTWIDGVQIGN